MIETERSFCEVPQPFHVSTAKFDPDLLNRPSLCAISALAELTRSSRIRETGSVSGIENWASFRPDETTSPENRYRYLRKVTL